VELYVKLTGAPPSVAANEMAKQQLAHPGIESLRKEFAGRLAGVYWENYPHQAIHVRLTGKEAVAPRVLKTDAGVVPVVFVSGASEGLEAQKARLMRALPMLSSMIPGLMGAGVDERTGIVQLDVISAESDAFAYDEEKESIEKLLGMKVRFSLSKAYEEEGLKSEAEVTFDASPHARQRLASAGTSVLPGGWRLDGASTWCTGGFTVRHVASGKKGVLTAGHCLNSMIYSDYPQPPATIPSVILPANMEQEWWGGGNDFQWHSFDNGIEVNAVFCKDYINCGEVVVLQIPNPALGTAVCHMGATTGRSCGVVAMLDYKYVFSPEHPCPNSPENCPTGYWILITGSNLPCAGGHSGGPLFAGTTAYGLAKGARTNGKLPGQCAELIVMPIDRVTSAGFNLL